MELTIYVDVTYENNNIKGRRQSDPQSGDKDPLLHPTAVRLLNLP